MLAVDKLTRNRCGPILLIGSATSVTEPGMATKGHKFVSTTIRAGIKSTAVIRIATVHDLGNFMDNNRTNIWMTGKKGTPVIRKNLLNGKVCTHDIT